MTPIEKNIIVVDEQGNEYEATYPKRAKGLVKNGRARFIDENTICLACPPNTELEDKNMSENTTTIEQPLTAREIFEKITELQRLITESPVHPHEVFVLREKTFAEMLALYRKMYADLHAVEIAQNPAMQKQYIIDEMLQIIKDKTSYEVTKKYARKVIDTYMSSK